MASRAAVIRALTVVCGRGEVCGGGGVGKGGECTVCANIRVLTWGRAGVGAVRQRSLPKPCELYHVLQRSGMAPL